MTLFYVHINTVGIALWKEQNNSMLEQVVQYKRKSRKYNACEKVTSKKPKKPPTPTEFIQSTDFSKLIFATFLIKLHLSHSVWIYTSSFNILSQAWKSGHTHARRDYFGKFSSDAAPNPPHLPPLSPCTWFQIEHSPDVTHYLTWGLCPRKCIHSKQALIVSWISFIHVFKLNPSVFTLKWSKTAATSLILEISPLRWALVNSWINWHSKSWYLPGEERDNTKNPSGYVIQAKTVILTVLLTSLIIF